MAQNIFKNPFVSSAPALTGPSVGNGTLTIDRLSHFTITQDYSAICTAIAPFTVFKVIGSLDGAVGVAVVSQPFNDEDLKLFLTVEQGPTLFQIGDTFEFSVEQGIDLNRENIDLYDELTQKNFGVGTVGQLSGDHSLRFGLSGTDASLIIGDLSFVSNLVDNMEGNEISIEFIEGSVLTAASTVIQDLTFTADALGDAGNNITIEYQEFTQGIFAFRFIQDLVYSSLTYGPSSDLINITYVGGGTAGAEVATLMSGTDIEVTIEDGVSTAQQIRGALVAVPAIVALISASATGTGLEPQSIQTQLFLQNGADPIGDAGNEVVSVLVNAITVILESGTSTATQVKDAIDAFPAAAALINTVISGTAGNAQTAPEAATNLTGGFDDVGIPGSEIVQVVGDKLIQVTFITGASTATQVKAAMDAVVAVTDLITIGIPGTAGSFQTSNLGPSFLRGGRPNHTYSFNKEELTQAGAFFEGNASLSLYHLITQGKLLVIDNATFNKDVRIDEDLSVGQDVDIDGNIDVEGTARVGGDTTVEGNTILEQDLTVEGVSTLNGKVTLDDEIGANNSGDSVDNLQQSINNLIQNHKILVETSGDKKPIWLAPQLTLDTDDVVIKFLDSGIVNTIVNANFPQTIADGEVLYVQLDRLNNVNVVLQKATTIPSGKDFMVIGLRSGTRFLWNVNAFLSDFESYDGILLVKEHDSNKKRTEVLSGTRILTDGTTLGAVVDNMLANFPGAEIDWVNGDIYQADGTTPLGVNFTAPVIPNGEFMWASITLVDGDPLEVLNIAFGSTTDVDPDLAEKPSFGTGVPLGLVKLEGDGVNIVDVLQDDIIQVPLGSGGGGAGVGDITQIMEELRALIRRLDFTWVTEWDGRIHGQDYEDTTTSSFNDGYSFGAIGQNLVTTNLYGSRFLAGDRISKSLRLDIFQDPEAVALDPSFTAELSQDGGANYYAITMEQIAESSHFTGDIELPQDALSIIHEYDVAEEDTDLVFNDTAQQFLAIPFIVTSKEYAPQLTLFLNKLGAPNGQLDVIIAKDNAGPSLDSADLVRNVDSILMSNLAAGDIAPVIDLGILDLPAGTYWVIAKPSDSYRASFDSGVTELRARTDASAPSYADGDSQAYDGAAWAALADTSICYKLEGFQYNLKLRYTAGTADSALIGYGVFYGEFSKAYEAGSKQVEYVLVDGDLDETAFTISNFVIDPKQLRIYDPSAGQVYTWSEDAGTFDINGNDITFPAGFFLQPGEKFYLIFDQSTGGFDNSDENASLLADNHLGSLNASLSRAKAGKGIKLLPPTEPLQHIWLDDDLNIIIEDA